MLYFLTAFLFVAIIFIYIIVNKNYKSMKSDRIDRFFKDNKGLRQVTLNEKLIVDSYSKKEVFIVDFGLYRYSFDTDFGSIEMTYLFGENNTITKEIKTYFKSLDKTNTLTGYADITVNGSTMIFSNVVGDEAIFSSIGEAIFFDKDGLICLPYFDNKSGLIKKFCLSKVKLPEYDF